jgi:stage III sporulation protein AH
MKKIAIIKKKEVLLGLLAIFFMIVGFISYNPIANKEYSKIADITNYSETKLGEATLVSSNEVVENVTDEAQTSENTITEEIQKDYFLEARMSRDSIYSESLETYEKLLESSSVTNDQKAIAQNEISNITNEKKTIQSTESLIKMKGFEDVVIFKNSESVSVVVKSDVLLPEQVAQIQNIVEREFKINGKNINITNK